MKLEAAVEIVMSLARENVLDDKEVLEDPELFSGVQKTQQEAIATVEDFFVNNVFS